LWFLIFGIREGKKERTGEDSKLRVFAGIGALKRPNTKIIGTLMARLNGAVNRFQMPNTKIGFTFPAEKLFTVKGLPREKYIPEILVDPASKGSHNEQDIFISRALIYLGTKH